jgi:hypothetical protein
MNKLLNDPELRYVLDTIRQDEKSGTNGRGSED